MPTDSRASRRALLLLAVCAFLWTALRSWGYLIDDTFITLRFARNLIEGNGLVFNLGERVEGYTSLGLVLIAAPLLALGIDPVIGLGLLSGAMAACTLLLTARVERELVGPEAVRPALSALLLLASSAFAYWSLQAMETLLFTALLLAGVCSSLREARMQRWRGSGVLFALLCLMRPEGPFVFGVFTAALAFAERSGRGDWSHLRRHLENALIVFAVVAIHFAWRWHYYGELLPNTYYAKVTGGAGQLATGLHYLREFSLANPVLAASLLFPLALLSRRLRTWFAQPALALVVYATLAAWVGYVVAVGADFMPYFRFFVPALPFCAVLAAGLLRGAPRLSSGGVVLALLAVQAGAGLATEQPYRAFVAHRTAVVGERVGAWLRERLSPHDWIAVNTAGAVPYFSRLPAIDMLGLTDAQIAHRPIYIVSEGWAGHRRGWGEYVLSRRPRVILWYNSAGLAEPHYLSDHELADSALFRFFYTLHATALPPASDSEPDAVLQRFLGFPFGYDPGGASSIPDLGLRLRFRDSPFGMTTLQEGPLRIVRFELDSRDDDLWQEALRLKGDLRAFVAAAAERWAAQERPAGDFAARAEVETLCAQALGAIEAGNREEAKRILAGAARLNGRARSPRLPQYVANLAVMSGELFTAVAAQKEALRLDPRSQLYRENLLRLLTLPYARMKETPISSSAAPSTEIAEGDSAGATIGAR
jgi:hypothetical protein